MDLCDLTPEERREAAKISRLQDESATRSRVIMEWASGKLSDEYVKEHHPECWEIIQDDPHFGQFARDLRNG